jgi:Cu(I)/Ag(I) efflux system membrane fusion protein
VRFEFPNAGMRLKPQMYADVFIELESATGIVIPDSAVIETGLRQIVFVDLGDGGLEPREVKIGVRGDGKAQVLSGVKEGEKVAVKANFLLDSESRLRAALTGMTGGPASSTTQGRPQQQGQPKGQQQSQPAPGGHEGHGGAR